MRRSRRHCVLTIPPPYGNIARAVGILSCYGEESRTLTPLFMRGFDPDELDPPELVRFLALDELDKAQRFIQQLIAWKTAEQQDITPARTSRKRAA